MGLEPPRSVLLEALPAAVLANPPPCAAGFPARCHPSLAPRPPDGLEELRTKKSVLRSWTLDTASINTPNPCRPSVLLAPLELPQSFQQFEPQLASGQWSLQPIRMNMFENRPTKLGQTKPEDGFAHMISRLEEVHANHIQPPMTNTDDSHQSRHQN